MNVNYTITSPFGSRSDPFTGEESFHSGIDLWAPAGTDIVASAGGKVYKTGYEANGLGNYVKIQHDVSGAVNSETSPTGSADGSPLEPSAINKTNAIINSTIIAGESFKIKYTFFMSFINDHLHYQINLFLLLVNGFELVIECPD